MNIVLARPYDDDDIVEIYSIVPPEDTLLLQGLASAFDTAWETAKEKVMAANEETWNIKQIIEELEAQGWKIKHLDILTTVTY